MGVGDEIANSQITTLDIENYLISSRIRKIAGKYNHVGWGLIKLKKIT